MKKLWKLIHKFGSYPFIYSLCNKLIPCLGIISLLMISCGTFLGLFYVPMDYLQKDAFRIIYIHVPFALLSLSIYTTIGISSIIYLIWHIKVCDAISKSIAPFGAIITLLALLTGSIWGKPMWGTWWVWDARLTSELILLMLFIGYIALRNAIDKEDIAAKSCAILAIIGLIDIPIIHFSVEWWQTLHQGATISKFSKPSISTEMLIPLMIMLIGFYLLFITITLYNLRTEITKREIYSNWIKKYV